MDDNKKYYAFISYRHLDNSESGRHWASWLQQAIETYEIPEELVGKRNNRGEEIPSRIYPVFRDEEALPTDPNLNNVINQALNNSRFLIVLCSPNARQSKYVASEISYFKKLGHSNQIIAAIIAGEPNVSLNIEKLPEGFTEKDECYPEPLQFIFDAEGKQTKERAEPVAADFRIRLNNIKQQGWTSPQALQAYLHASDDYRKSQISELVANYEKQLRLMLLKIIAGMIGVPTDDLTQRDKAYQLGLARQKAKQLRKWLSAVTALAVIAIGAGLVAWKQQQLAVTNEHRALEQRNQSLISQSRFLLDQARQANDDDRDDLALLLGLNAAPGPYGGDRPTPQSMSELRRSLLSQNKLITIAADKKVLDANFNAKGDEFYILTDSPDLRIYNSQNGQIIQEFTHNKKLQAVALSSDNTLLATNNYDNITIWNRNDKTVKVKFKTNSKNNSLIFSQNNKTLFVGGDYGHLQSWNLDSGDENFRVKEDHNSLDYLHLSKDHKMILSMDKFTSNINIWSTKNGDLLQTIEREPYFLKNSRLPYFTGDSTAVVYFNTHGTSVLNLKNGESTTNGLQIHTIMNYAGDQAVLLPANNQIQGELDDIIKIESLKKTPVLHNLKENKSINLNHFSNNVSDAFFTPDDRYVITMEFDTLHFWHQNKGLKSHDLELPATPSKTIISPDSQRLITYFNDEDFVKVWQIDQNWPEVNFDIPYKGYAAKLSPKGTYAYLPSIETKNTPFTIIHTAEPYDTIALNNSCGSPKETTFSDDEKRIYVECSGNEPGQVIDLNSGEQLSNITKKDELYTQLETSGFSPDGKYLLTIPSVPGGYNVKIFDIDAPDSEPLLIDLNLDRSPWGIEFSSDSKLAVIRHRKNKLFFIDTETGILINEFNSEHEIKLFSFGKNNKSFYLYLENHQTINYSMANNKPILELQNKEDLAQLISLDNENLIALVSKNNGDIGLWSSLNGQFLERIAIDGNKNTKYQLSPNQHYLYSIGAPVIAVSVKSKGVFFKEKGFNAKNIIIDEITDEIILLSDTGIRRLPAYSDNIVAQGIKKLNSGRKCMTNQERERYFLPRLTKEQTLERNCD